ncbi:UNKNOWN [Stylonychia lemnae]|uniref:Uncharacterized protein n=1 Tax=Stylonychia lemnae TaxID=5949 RepID=A0A078A6F5_STYLE|nr:UNKNOWN [Stylonychia lemnae]|eukprot:CDW77845.1 UNKNOWN [Stylonychia lemnae]
MIEDNKKIPSTQHKRPTAAELISDQSSSDGDSKHYNSAKKVNNSMQDKLALRVEKKKKRDHKKLVKQALKEKILQDTLSNDQIRYEQIKPSNIDLDLDENLIDSALNILNKSNEPKLDFKDPETQIKDFQKIVIPGTNLSISQNRYKNEEIFAFGGFMDKDIPIYKRVSSCRQIIGLEHERRLSAQILIDLNERLGYYNNRILKRIAKDKKREGKMRFYQDMDSVFDDSVKVQTDAHKVKQTEFELKNQVDFISIPQEIQNMEKSEQISEEKQQMEDYLSGNLKINYNQDKSINQKDMKSVSSLMNRITRNKQDIMAYIEQKYSQPSSQNECLSVQQLGSNRTLKESDNRCNQNTENKQAGYPERAFKTYQVLIEFKLSRLLNIETSDYEYFCGKEYPHIGEMLGFNGYPDFIKLAEQGKQDTILENMLPNIIKEDDKIVSIQEDIQISEIKAENNEIAVLKQWIQNEKLQYFSLRPRKTYLDEDFIQINPESIVFYDDVKEIIDMIDIKDYFQLNRILLSLNKFLEIPLIDTLNCTTYQKKQHQLMSSQFEDLKLDQEIVIYPGFHQYFNFDKHIPILIGSELIKEGSIVIQYEKYLNKDYQVSIVQLLSSFNEMERFNKNEINKKFKSQILVEISTLFKIQLQLTLYQQQDQLNQIISTQEVILQMNENNQKISNGQQSQRCQYCQQTHQGDNFANCMKQNGLYSKTVIKSFLSYEIDKMSANKDMKFNRLERILRIFKLYWSSMKPVNAIKELLEAQIKTKNVQLLNDQNSRLILEDVEEIQMIWKSSKFKDIIMEKELESMRDLYIQKGLRINQSGLIDDIPIPSTNQIQSDHQNVNQ